MTIHSVENEGRSVKYRRVKLCFLVTTILALACIWPQETVVFAQGVSGSAEEVYYSANALYNRKLYELAVTEYTSFIQKFPTHAKVNNARMGLGLSHYALKDYEKAKPYLAEAAAGAIPNREQVRFLLGQCMLQLNQAAEAESTFQQVSAATVPVELKAEALAGQAEALFLQQKWAELVPVSDSLVKLEPDKPRSLRARFQGGVARQRLGQFDVAIKELVAVKDKLKDPNLVHQSVFLLAECKRETGDLKGAAEGYQLAATTHPGSFSDQSRFRLGYVHFSLTNYAAARDALVSFTKKTPGHAMRSQSDVLLGRSHLELKAYDKARVLLAARVKAEPGNQDAALWLARTYSRQGQYADAEKHVRQALAHAPTGSVPARELLFDLGNAEMAGEKFAEAASTFNKVYTAEPKWAQAADALRLMALCLHRAGQYPASLAACTKFSTAFPKDPRLVDVEFLKAENEYLSDQDAVAKATYTAFLTKYATDANANSATLRLGQILYREKKWSEVLTCIAPLLSKPPADPFFRQLVFLAGDAQYNLKQWDKAIVSLTSFVDKQGGAGGEDTALLKLALAHLQLDEKDKGVARLQELVKTHAKSEHLPVALVELGRLHYDAGRSGPARVALTRAVTDFGDSSERPKAEYYLGWIALAEDRDDDAAGHFSTVIAKGPAHVLAADALLQRGLIEIKMKTYDKAQVTLGAFLQAHATHAKADYGRFYLGVAQARSGQWDKALPLFKVIAAKPVTSPLVDRALYEWAWCEKGLKRPQDAIARYTTLLQKFPTSELKNRASFELAELESESDKLVPAIKRLTAILPTLKDAALKEQVLYRLGWCELAKGNNAAALKHLKSVITSYPKSDVLGLAHYHSGEASLNGKEYVSAREHFAKATAHAKLPDAFKETAQLRLGETQGLTGQWADSEATYISLLKAYSESAWSRRSQLGLGWALENQKDYAGAMQSYRKILARTERDETAARAQFQVGECLFSLKQYDDSLRELLKVEINYAYPEWVSRSMLEIGRVLEGKNEKVSAIDQYELLLEKYPDSEPATVARKRIEELSK
jgi:TolA-binding protein